MRIAIIDCGTNTFHLLIADKKTDGSFSFLFRLNIPVKLGQGGMASGVIAEIPFQRGIAALENFSVEIKKHAPQKVIAYATAAIRKALNGNDFVDEAFRQTGIQLTVINGNREAELIYYGVKHAVNLTHEKVLIMDIGGGSVEFIICNKNEIFWKQSFEIGAALLLEKFKPSDPVTHHDIEKINQHLQNTLQPLFLQIINNQFSITNLIGSSGSFDTFAELISWQFQNKPLSEEPTSFLIDMDNYKQIHSQLINSAAAERIKMKGMIPMRVDMIVIASLLLTFVIEKLKIKTITLSSYALKEGMLFERINNE